MLKSKRFIRNFGKIISGLEASNWDFKPQIAQFRQLEPLFSTFVRGGGAMVERVDLQSSTLDLKPQIGQFGLHFFSTGGRGEGEGNSR